MEPEPDGAGPPPRRPSQFIPWKPGQSGNPLGQATSRLTLAKYIRQLSQDGQVYVKFLTAIMNGEPIPLPATNGQGRQASRRPSIDQQLRAVELLLDRGFGRAKEILELHQDDHAARAQRLALFGSMPQEDRDTIRGLLQKHIEAQNRAAPVEAIPPVPSGPPGEPGRAATPDAPSG